MLEVARFRNFPENIFNRNGAHLRQWQLGGQCIQGGVVVRQVVKVLMNILLLFFSLPKRTHKNLTS